MKVVINACYGGFSISKEAAEFMAKRGNEEAIKELNYYNERVTNPKDEMDKKYGASWYGYICNDDKDRTNEDLIAAVEELGDKANGRCAKLKIVEIPDGVNFVIEEYDGFEHISESHRTWG